MKLRVPICPNPPFSRSYWAVPGQILAGFYPGDRDASVARNKLNALLNCGVTHFCSLMEAGEKDHAGRAFEDYRPGLMELAMQRGKMFPLMSYPIRDVSVPTVPHMVAALDSLDAALAEGAVNSDGYVIDTLEAAVWCLLTTDDFGSCLLKAVNLGGDTDTTGCVAGGLAGVLYGEASIPETWRGALPRQRDLAGLIDCFVPVCESKEQVLLLGRR